MISESEEHKNLKLLLAKRVEEWFGASLPEYPSDGRESDVYGCTLDGVDVCIEVIWSDSKTHFLQDLLLLEQSNARVKITIASPSVGRKDEFVRLFKKSVLSQRKKNFLMHGSMLDGQALLSDTPESWEEFRRILSSLVKKGNSRIVEASKRISNTQTFVLDSSNASRLEATLKQYASRLVCESEHLEKLTRGGDYTIIGRICNIDLERYYIPFNAVDLGNKYSDDAAQQVFRWLKSDQRGLLVLGDFGTGKSSLCARFATDLAKQYLTGDSNRIPVIIPLRNIEEASVEAILDGIGREVEVNWTTLQALSGEGRLVVILDGFDEMIKRTDAEATFRNFQFFFDKLHTAKSKFVLTCRTHYFLKDSEIWGEDTALMERLRATKEFGVIKLEPFTELQIQDYLSRRTTDPGTIWKQIKETYNLLDLCKQPILIQMVVSTLPQLLASGRQIDASYLYEIYTGQWIDREESRSQLSSSDKAELMEEMAVDLYLSGRPGISPSEITKVIHSKLKAKPTSEAASFFDYDIRTCSFFNRDADGSYRFMHRSFQEFFVGRRIAREINASSVNSLKGRTITPELVFFSSLMIKSEQKLFLWSVIGNSKNSQDKVSGLLVGNLLKLLKKMGDDFKNRDLSSLSITDADLSLLDFGESNFSRSVLGQVDFSRSRFKKGSFNETELNSCILTSSSLVDTIFERCKIVDTNCSSSTWEDCKLNGARITGCGFANSSFQNCEISESQIVNCEFSKSKIFDSTIGGKWRGSSMVTARLEQDNLRGLSIESCDLGGGFAL